MCLEEIQHMTRDDTCPMQGRILRRIVEVVRDRLVLCMEVGTAHLADDEQLMIRTLPEDLLGPLDHIMIVGTGEALIRCHADDCRLIIPRFHRFTNRTTHIQVWMREILRQMTQDTLDHRLQRIEIRLGLRQIRLRLPELRTGDEVHGVGDFQRIIDARDTIPKLSCCCHDVLLSSANASRRHPHVPKPLRLRCVTMLRRKHWRYMMKRLDCARAFR